MSIWDTLQSVTHIGPGVIKIMPDALLALYAVLALLDLVTELGLWPGWRILPIACRALGTCSRPHRASP